MRGIVRSSSFVGRRGPPRSLPRHLVALFTTPGNPRSHCVTPGRGLPHRLPVFSPRRKLITHLCARFISGSDACSPTALRMKLSRISRPEKSSPRSQITSRVRPSWGWLPRAGRSRHRASRGRCPAICRGRNPPLFVRSGIYSSGPRRLPDRACCCRFQRESRHESSSASAGFSGARLRRVALPNW